MSNRLSIVPASAMPPDPNGNQKIATVRAQQAPSVREQASLALSLSITARQWINGNEPLISAMARLVTRLCDHVQLLEETGNVPEERRLKQMIDAEAKAAIEKAQATAAASEKVPQPAPQGENLIDPPEGPLSITVLLEAMDAHAATLGVPVQLLTEDSEGVRRWSTRDELAAGDLHGTPLKIGPKPATQFVNGARPPKVSDPDVPAPSIGQPPEKPA